MVVSAGFSALLPATHTVPSMLSQVSHIPQQVQLFRYVSCLFGLIKTMTYFWVLQNIFVSKQKHVFRMNTKFIKIIYFSTLVPLFLVPTTNQGVVFSLIY